MIRLKTRLLSAAAVSILALSLSACSDSSTEKAESAPTKATTQTASAADAAKPGVSTEVTGATESDAAKPQTVVEAPEPDGEVDMAAVLEPGPMKEMALGAEDAPVTIVEYMSMTCPHCAAFHQGTFGALVEKYVETGKVRFILREFPFDPRAAAAIMLARCAPEGQFFPMVDVLFEQQEVWATAQDARTELLNIARLAGFTQESFQACLTNQELLDDVNAVRNKAASEFGIQATPTFLINGKRYAGGMSIGQMSAIIDPLL